MLWGKALAGKSCPEFLGVRGSVRAYAGKGQTGNPKFEVRNPIRLRCASARQVHLRSEQRDEDPPSQGFGAASPVRMIGRAGEDEEEKEGEEDQCLGGAGAATSLQPLILLVILHFGAATMPLHLRYSQFEENFFVGIRFWE